MFNLLNTLYENCYKNPKKCISLFFLTFLIFSFFALKVEKNIVIKDQIDQNSFDFKRLDLLEKNFENDYQLFLLLSGDINNTRSICQVYTWLRGQILTEPNFVSLESIFSIREVQSEESRLIYPKILNLDCLNFSKINYNEIGNNPWNGILTPIKSQTDLLFTVVMQKKDISLSPPKFNSNVISNFDKNLTNFINTNNLNFEFNLLGWASNRRYVQDGIKATFALNLLLFVLMIILFKYFFGTIKSGFLLVLTLGLMGSYLYGLMAIFKIPIDMLNAGLFLLLSISALQDFIFILTNMKQKNISFYESAKTLLVPSFFTSFTTIIGFGSLYLTNLSTLQNFGLTAAFAALTEWILVFLFLPSFIHIFPIFSKSLQIDKSLKFDNLYKLTNFKPHKLIAISLLIAYVIGGEYVIHPKIHEEPFGIFKNEHPFTKGIRKLIESRQWSASFDVIFESQDSNSINNILSKIKKYPDVQKVISYQDTEDYLIKDLDTSSKKELVLREFKLTQLFKSFKNDQYTRAVVYIKKNEVSYASNIKKYINNICQEKCFATGNLIAYTEFGEKIPRALIESFSTSLILVSLTLLILTHVTIKRNYFAILISAMWGPFACLTLMKILNVPFNYITCLFASIIVGLTGDNTIQFLFNSNNNQFNENVKSKGIASILIFIFTSTCSLIFLFGYFKFSKEFGIIMILGNLLSIIGDIWILNTFKKDN